MRKIHLMAKTLKGLGVPAGARGLDVGCGHGWYLAEMRRLGYQVDGTDYSSGQLRQASEHLRAAGMSDGVLQQADASDLPFETGSYAFVYSINAVHHMVGPGTQNRALREIVRVLQPGGVFLLHEMNTENPLFRWYMGYLFPLLKRIDEGNEEWLRPSRLPAIPGARWQSKIDYFTFLPDFIPRPLLRLLQGVEAWLETSRLRRFSAHYQAYLLKTDEASSSGTSPSG
jgi:SAM-dependent methyltransferase